MMKMKYFLNVAILGMGASVGCLSADELWERSEQLVLNSAIWIPEQVETLQNVYNGKGQKEAENHISFMLSEDSKTGEPHGTLIQFLENEKDRTEKVRDELEADLRNELMRRERDFPYNLENPSDAVLGRRSETKTINSVECVGYDFVSVVCEAGEKEPYRFSGIVWIDPATAVPLEIESHLMDLPRMEEDAEIVSLLLNRKYGYENGAFVSLSEQQQLWINAKVFFKKIVVYIEEETNYRDHWKWKG